MLRDGEWITVLRVGPVIVVGVISKVIMIEAILPGRRGAPSGGREGEASMIVGGVEMISGGDGIGIGVVADGLRVGGHGRLLVLITNYAGMVEEFCLSAITSGIVGIGGMGVGRGVEGIRGKREIGLVRDAGSGRGMVVHWSAAETG